MQNNISEKTAISVNIVALLVVIALILGLIVVLPVLGIWAVNTLFATGIAYTFWNWLAMFVLMAIFGGGSAVNGSN